MKKLLLFVLVAMLAIPVTAQSVVGQKKGRVPSEKKASIAVGFMNGGGGLVGVDFEFLISQLLGVQGGIGFVSYGGALNYHFKPYINSSMVSLAYFHQGIGNSYTYSWVGPLYTFRAPKIFQASIGYGICVGQGPAVTEAYSGTLIYNIGLYFPI